MISLRRAKLNADSLKYIAGFQQLESLAVGNGLASASFSCRRGSVDSLRRTSALKSSNADDFIRLLKLSWRGTLIIADNVVRRGAVIDAASSDPSVLGIRRFNE